MSSGSVAKRYAKAFFEVAAEKGQLDTIEKELQGIQQVMVDNPVFLQLLHHPQIDKKVKKKEINTIFKGQISDITLDFINLLIDGDRGDILPSVTTQFVELANLERGIADALVTSVKPLTEAEIESIGTKFSEVVNKKIRIQNVVDPSIIGGIIVKIGDRLYDGSVIGKLNRFKQSVLS
jgi:F-type H+-transporting ATPase subunit delta